MPVVIGGLAGARVDNAQTVVDVEPCRMIVGLDVVAVGIPRYETLEANRTARRVDGTVTVAVSLHGVEVFVDDAKETLVDTIDGNILSGRQPLAGKGDAGGQARKEHFLAYRSLGAVQDQRGGKTFLMFVHSNGDQVVAVGPVLNIDAGQKRI